MSVAIPALRGAVSWGRGAEWVLCVKLCGGDRGESFGLESGGERVYLVGVGMSSVGPEVLNVSCIRWQV